MASSSLTSRFLGRSRAAWPYHYVGGSCQDPGSPGSPRSPEFPLRLLRCEVVREFLLLPDRAAQGLPDIFSRFFRTSTERRLLSPAASVFPPLIHSAIHNLINTRRSPVPQPPSDCAASPERLSHVLRNADVHPGAEGRHPGLAETTTKNESGLARSSAEVITEAPCCTGVAAGSGRSPPSAP